MTGCPGARIALSPAGSTGVRRGSSSPASCGWCWEDVEKGERMHHIVALSGGKDSTALALRLAEVEPRDYTYVCTPTGDEPQAFFDHLDYLRRVLGKPILPIMHPLGLNGLIAKKQALPNHRARWCTQMLKITPY